MIKTYDTIIIGSGAGGLTAAVALAQAGQKVLVCEQHGKPGGWTHSFTLNGYRFSPGVHYIGGIEEGGSLNRTYRGLGVSNHLEFCELNPEGFDHIVIGDKQYDFPKGKENLKAKLTEYFPHEAKGIEGYIEMVDKMVVGVNSLGKVKNAKTAVTAAGNSMSLLRWATRSGQDLIEHFITDPILRGVLAGQSGDHGMPPSQVSAFVHAGITHHYFNGGFYPRGGAFAIPRAFLRELKQAGGEIRLRTSVEKILIEDGKTIGIRLADGEIIHSKNVVSNADPEVTFGKLIGRESLSQKLVNKLDRVTYSTSALSLFFAVDMDLRAAGLDSGNFWFYDDEDVGGAYEDGLTDAVLKAEMPSSMFLTVTTLKDPSKMHGGHHTCEAFTFVDYGAFEQWSNSRKSDRPAGYEAEKEELAEKLFRKLEKHVPGISKNIVFWSLATPLTNEHYLNATRGNQYGISKSRRQVGPGAFPIRTEIDGLFLCGASTLSHGVAGVTASGIAAAKSILGCKTSDLFTQNGAEMKIYPSDDISAWPENLQDRIERGKEK
ncbi:MAG: NAD(P)/FAD-dependent oxidoreductase [Anaerolineae bacterium]|jgi:phytoene dehydrogenase-like protein|nr:NAD(P)/FAD-dependent oxidoreductase [Anaerolineae bacterium]MBT4310381.1 NAD(P)/FAD-dependent oxidoreductase [Anaerolineae bacterium]MBT4458897.1 NAD(P)/FAD-dependent oxidoreductase [Anaerolineae bacterium]MBT4842375.1 NAD(P)/FAD-dependent oxidoreductase [Anaerolineae bacterium]MBT6062155.1 NAD(P)/FAD-dependent oxidoreductase [Anaerolineae bacterium]